MSLGSIRVGGGFWGLGRWFWGLFVGFGWVFGCGGVCFGLVVLYGVFEGVLRV